MQLCAVDKLLAARLTRRRREEDHRETIRTCGQPMQKSTFGRVHAGLHRADSRLLETSEPSTVARVPLALPMDDFNQAQSRRQEYARRFHLCRLRDELTPAVHSLFLTTDRAPLFLGSTHERRQFFRLVGRLGVEGRMGGLIVTGSHANRAGHRRAGRDRRPQVTRSTTADAGHDAEETTQNSN